MAIKFKCPACGKSYEVQEKLAGRSAKCQCGGRIVIPSPAAPNDDFDLEPVAGGAPVSSAVGVEASSAVGPDNIYINPDAVPPSPSLLADVAKIGGAASIGAFASARAFRDGAADGGMLPLLMPMLGGAVVGGLAGAFLTLSDRVRAAAANGSKFPRPVIWLFGRGAWSFAIWAGSFVGVLLLLGLVVGYIEHIGTSDNASQIAAPVPRDYQKPLQDQRAGFETDLVPNSFEPTGPAPDPPAVVFRKVRYSSPVGDLVAYVTPDPADGRRRPAIVWAHGGFGGIGEWLWEPATAENDQSVAAFRDAGLVVMCPSWRGEHDNPGQFELFFGEVDDLIAAGEYAAKLPYVDPDRVYVAGHSTGGTLALLAACSNSPFRAAFSFGGAPDVERVIEEGGYENTPFEVDRPNEAYFRSPINFAMAIQIPTFYFEGGESGYIADAKKMESLARNNGCPMVACVITGGDHFDVLRPLTRFVASAVKEDSGSTCAIQITQNSANDTYVTYWNGYRRRKREFFEKTPYVVATPEAIAWCKQAIAEQNVPAGRQSGVRLLFENGDLSRLKAGQLDITDNDIVIHQDGVTFAFDKRAIRPQVGLLLTRDKDLGNTFRSQTFDE